MLPRRLRIPLAILALALLALFAPIRFSVHTEFWERLMDAVHLPFFAAFTFFVAAANPLGLVDRRQRITCAGVTALLVAAAVEAIQPATGREESFVDLCNGIFGIALAVAWLHLWRARACAVQLGLLLAGLALAVLTLRPAWREMRGLFWQSRNFPLLGDFESDDEFRLWITSGDDERRRSPTVLRRSSDHTTRGASSLMVTTAGAPWPGVRLLTGDMSWTGWRTLAFEVFNPGEPFTLALRIDDAGSRHHADRFNDAVPLDRGWNHVRVALDRVERSPAERPLRLQEIRRVLFFIGQPVAPHTFYIDNVRLER